MQMACTYLSILVVGSLEKGLEPILHRCWGMTPLVLSPSKVLVSAHPWWAFVFVFTIFWQLRVMSLLLTFKFSFISRERWKFWAYWKLPFSSFPCSLSYLCVGVAIFPLVLENVGDATCTCGNRFWCLLLAFRKLNPDSLDTYCMSWLNFCFKMSSIVSIL